MKWANWVSISMDGVDAFGVDIETLRVLITAMVAHGECVLYIYVHSEKRISTDDVPTRTKLNQIFIFLGSRGPK